MQVSINFPLRGVIGVVTSSTDEVDQAIAKGLQCIEIRADQLLDSGLSMEQIIAIVTRAKAANLATLFTLRHPAHGGKFSGSEQERVDINRQAISAGTNLIDLEWETEASKQMLSENTPMVLSYHDFDGMLAQTELDGLSQKMSENNPQAIKIVPTASSISEAAQMLQWLEEPGKDQIARIGFCMGSVGSCSRILTTAFGAPITYASLGEANAPGQVPIDDLLENYHVMDLDQQTVTVAVVGDGSPVSETLLKSTIVKLNRQFRSVNSNKVAIGFKSDTLGEIESLRKTLRISETLVL